MSDRHLPDVGTKVVHHRQFGTLDTGEVAPTDSWEHAEELTDDSFVVEFADRRSRFRLDQATAVEEVIHIGP